jgi:hypothetical protein
MNRAGARSESNGKHFALLEKWCAAAKSQDLLRQRDQNLDTKDEGRPNRSGAADQATPLSGAKRKKSKQWKRDLGAGALRATRKKTTNK